MPDERPEIFYAATPTQFDVSSQPLSAWQKLMNNSSFRKTLLLVALAAAWQAYATWLANPLLLPTFSATVRALINSIGSGELPRAPSGPSFGPN